MIKTWSLFQILACILPISSQAFNAPSHHVGRKQNTIYGKAQFTYSLYSERKDDGDLDFNLLSLENEVMASTRAKLDLQRVTKAFTETETDASSTTTEPAKQALLASTWRVSLAAAFFTSCLTLFLSTNILFAAVAFVGTFWIAYQDPLEEEGVTGALARVLGRWTIQSVETTTPKIRAVARAAITSENEEITQRLQSQVQVLEQQNSELALWKERRLAVDENLGNYTREELKELARQNNLAVGGKKHELMMRLLEADALQL
jgi:hypothetical protein